jgi:hypothetical protein
MKSFLESVIAALRENDAETPVSSIVPHVDTTENAHDPPLIPSRGHSAALAPTLRHIFNDRDPTQCGSVHLLGLESLHARLSARWPAVAERVHQLTERLLEQKLGPGDAWFRHGPETYVIVFSHLGADQARLICAKVLEELQKLLLGNADTDSIVVHTAVHEVGSELMFAPAKLKDMLDAAVSRGRQVLAAGTPAVAATPATTSQAAASLWAGPLEVKYRPAWDFRQQVLSIYIARCTRLRKGRQSAWGYECQDDPADPHQILQTDLTIASRSLEVALELYDNRFRFFLSLPVHFESLAAQSRRRELVALLQTIPAHLRPLMTYHLTGMPTGVPGGRLSEIVSTLRPFGRTIMVVVDIAGGDLQAVAASGAKVASLLLPHGVSAERLRPDMLRFGAMATKLRLFTSVEGVEDEAMEKLCEEAGVAFLAGGLIGGWMDVPENALRMTRTDIMQPH